MKIAKSIAVILFLMILGAFLAYVMWSGSNLKMEPNPDISEADFLAIILSALGVILAALAIFLGGMALVSWRMFDDRVKAHTEEFLERRFSPTDERYAELVETLRDDARREMAIMKKGERKLENISDFDEDAV